MLLEEIEPGKLEYRELIENLNVSDNMALVSSQKLNLLIKDFTAITKTKKEQVDLSKIESLVRKLEYLVSVRSYFQINES